MDSKKLKEYSLEFERGFLEAAKQGDIQSARQICEWILNMLKEDKPIDGYCKEYLVEALEKILKGKSANDAMLLKHKKGRPQLYYAIKFQIYSEVEKRHKNENMPYDEAYEVLSKQRWSDDKTRGIDAIEKAHKEIQVAIAESMKQIDEALEAESCS